MTRPRAGQGLCSPRPCCTPRESARRPLAEDSWQQARRCPPRTLVPSRHAGLHRLYLGSAHSRFHRDTALWSQEQWELAEHKAAVPAGSSGCPRPRAGDRHCLLQGWPAWGLCQQPAGMCWAAGAPRPEMCIGSSIHSFLGCSSFIYFLPFIYFFFIPFTPFHLFRSSFFPVLFGFFPFSSFFFSFSCMFFTFPFTFL